MRHAWTFLSASAPKYHVETVRSLWLLQTFLGGDDREIEAAVCALMLEGDMTGTFAARSANPGRRFGVLWSQSLQDSPYGLERRASGFKIPNGEIRVGGRLGGIDHYKVMLSRPLFLMLDALNDERTQLFMTVKTWLHSLIGTEKYVGRQRIFASADQLTSRR